VNQGIPAHQADWMGNRANSKIGAGAREWIFAPAAAETFYISVSELALKAPKATIP